MAKRCKHKSGIFLEIMYATHSRIVEEGEIEKSGYNDIGNIINYEFNCSDCKKKFTFSCSAFAPKWAQKYFDGL